MKPDGYIAFAIWSDGSELEIDSPLRATREEAEHDAENRIAELADNERRFIRDYGASPCIDGTKEE